MTIEDLRFDFDLLLSHTLNLNRSSLYAHSDKIISAEELNRFRELINRRLSGEPFAYIIGQKGFMNLELIVNHNVLIPRPETEILVEEVIKRLKSINEQIFIADIGTGSGAISISIADSLPNVIVDAVDISESAIKVARQNAINNQLEDRINFYVGDLFNPLNKKYHAILSNPPYIPSAIVDELEVTKFEPRIALDGGIDGLNFYRRLIDESKEFLIDDGFLAFEIGYNQADAIKQIVQHKFNCEVIKDLANLDRVMILTNDSKSK